VAASQRRRTDRKELSSDNVPRGRRVDFSRIVIPAASLRRAGGTTAVAKHRNQRICPRSPTKATFLDQPVPLPSSATQGALRPFWMPVSGGWMDGPTVSSQEPDEGHVSRPTSPHCLPLQHKGLSGPSGCQFRGGGWTHSLVPGARRRPRFSTNQSPPRLPLQHKGLSGPSGCQFRGCGWMDPQRGALMREGKGKKTGRGVAKLRTGEDVRQSSSQRNDQPRRSDRERRNTGQRTHLSGASQADRAQGCRGEILGVLRSRSVPSPSPGSHPRTIVVASRTLCGRWRDRGRPPGNWTVVGWRWRGVSRQPACRQESRAVSTLSPAWRA
jgi:hypothetical protein